MLLVAHGTRSPHGVAVIGDLAAAMRERLRVRVRVAFVDVLGPNPAEALASSPLDDEVTVVPAFLGRGHHVRRDLPRHLTRPGLPPTRVTDSLGPSAEIVRALADRLAQAGRRPGDAVVLAAAGSSDPSSHADVETVARDLAARVDAPVEVAFAAPTAAAPHYRSVEAVVTAMRRRHDRVAVASHLLAPGLFQSRLDAAGADVVARPLGLHPSVLDRVCRLASLGHAPGAFDDAEVSAGGAATG
ncbi:sirohydrochlorin chelatase [Gordonia humi]